jgi:osmotically inducible lipoprotein OsmB
MKHIAVVFIILAFVSTLGCSGMTRTQQKTLSGAGIGAGGGAVLGAVTGGSPVVGAVVGSGVGAVTGYILGESDKK